MAQKCLTFFSLALVMAGVPCLGLKDVMPEGEDTEGGIGKRLHEMIQVRSLQKALHPLVPQRWLDWHPGLFSLIRGGGEGQPTLLALVNLGAREIEFVIPGLIPDPVRWTDLLTGVEFHLSFGAKLILGSYAIHWLVPVDAQEGGDDD